MQKNKIRLLCEIPNTEDATNFYRGTGPIGHLQKTSELSIDLMVTDDISDGLFHITDALFSQRPFTAKHVQHIMDAKEWGKPVWVDYDDDLFSVTSDNPAFSIFGTAEIQQNVTRAIELADVVSVSTFALADSLWKRGLQKNYVVINNALDFSLFNWNSKPRLHANKVMWRGSASHLRDMLTVTNELVDLIQKTEGFEFYFVGDNQWVVTDRCPQEKVRMVKALTVRKYFNFIREMMPKVFIAPLLNSKFNLSKSNIAWLEATWAGAVCVCPEMPEWKNPGALNYTNAQHFRTLLKQAMDMSPDEHEKLWLQSLECAHEKYNLDKINGVREGILRGFM